MEDRIVERLKRISLFAAFKEDEDAIRRFASVMTVKVIPPNDYIIREGEEGSEMYILDRGRVMIEKNTLQDEKYAVVSLTDKMNIFFGEQALMDSDVRSAHVMAELECECFVLTKDNFEKLGDEHPHLGLPVTREIAKAISGRLRTTSKDLVMLFEAFVQDVEEG